MADMAKLPASKVRQIHDWLVEHIDTADRENFRLMHDHKDLVISAKWCEWSQVCCISLCFAVRMSVVMHMHLCDVVKAAGMPCKAKACCACRQRDNLCLMLS